MLIVSAGHRDFVTGWTAHGAGTALKRNNRFSLRKTDRMRRNVERRMYHGGKF